jgi:prepilin-type N-terminal cleavage/methylation domain-containing protein
VKKFRSVPGREGFTLVEIMIAMTILAVVGGAITLAIQSSMGVYSTATRVVDLEDQGRYTIQRIKGMLLATSQPMISPTPGSPASSNSIDFQRAVGEVGLAITWGNLERIQFQYEPSELNDGVDNNNNGLIDEGRVVWIQDVGLPTQRQVVLSKYVREFLQGETPAAGDENGNGLLNESGLCFDFAGNNVNIRMTIERFDSQGVLITRTFQSTITVRN